MSDKHKIITACKAKHECYQCKFEAICPDKVKLEHKYEMLCTSPKKSLHEILE